MQASSPLRGPRPLFREVRHFRRGTSSQRDPVPREEDDGLGRDRRVRSLFDGKRRLQVLRSQVTGDLDSADDTFFDDTLSAVGQSSDQTVVGFSSGLKDLAYWSSESFQRPFQCVRTDLVSRHFPEDAGIVFGEESGCSSHPFEYSPRAVTCQ